MMCQLSNVERAVVLKFLASAQARAEASPPAPGTYAARAVLEWLRVVAEHAPAR